MKTCLTSLLWSLALLPVSLDCRGATEAEIAERNTFIASNHLGRASLAYRSVASQKMLAEANYFSTRLHLPTPHPLRISDVAIHPAPPLFSRIDNTNFSSLADRLRNAKFVVSGNIDTTNFSFYYTEGYLWSLGRGPDSPWSYDEHAPSLIDTNGAYRLATQWLGAVDIDIAALEKKYKPAIEQEWYLRPGFGTGDTNIILAPRNPATGDIDYASIDETSRIFKPIYRVTWGGEVAKVRILGTRKELIELHLGDLSLSRRPQLVITNAIELNNTPDPPGVGFHRAPPTAPTNASAQVRRPIPPGHTGN